MYFSLFIKILLKALIKLANAISWLYTQIALFFPRDPTTIFIKNRTHSQISSLEKIQFTEKPNLVVGDQISKKMLWAIIPFRDKWHYTQRCLNSLLTQTLGNYSFGVILIDNDSKERQTLQGIEEFVLRAKTKNIRLEIIKAHGSFNFSAFNNSAVQKYLSDDDWVLFLNNDIELIAKDSLNTLFSFAILHESQIGALGCTLTYPSGRIQHLFAAPGIKIVAAHPGKGWLLDSSQRWFQGPQAVAAVTGAALLCHTTRFRAAGGFDESLPTLGQDIDLCLKFQKMSLTNWVLPQIVMIHAEGASKSPDFRTSEVHYIYQKWGRFLTDNPYYSSRLSRWSESPIYRIFPGRYPWEIILNEADTSSKEG